MAESVFWPMGAPGEGRDWVRLSLGAREAGLDALEFGALICWEEAQSAEVALGWGRDPEARASS